MLRRSQLQKQCDDNKHWTRIANIQFNGYRKALLLPAISRLLSISTNQLQ